MELEQIITLMDAMAKDGITGFSWEDEKNGVKISIKRKREALPKGRGGSCGDGQAKAGLKEKNIGKEAPQRAEPLEEPSGRIRVPANYNGTVHWEEGIQEGITLSKDKVLGHMILPNGVRKNLVSEENGVLEHLLVKSGQEVEKGKTLYDFSR